MHRDGQPTAMFDPLFLWLESSAVSVWIRESPSIFAFPIILAVHTIGLGLLAGINAAIDLRLLGVAAHIPIVEFRRFLPWMSVGLWLNVASGLALLVAYPTKALTNPLFYAKLALIAAALALLRSIRRSSLARDAAVKSFSSCKSLKALISSASGYATAASFVIGVVSVRSWASCRSIAAVIGMPRQSLDAVIKLA